MDEETIFFRALEAQSAEARAAFLDEACGSDSDKRLRVEQLLAAHNNPDSLFDHPAVTAAARAPKNSPLTRLGDFEIVRQIGQGGMGTVYEARECSLNRPVALKILSRRLGLTAKNVCRFRREAEAAARLHHTNIVPIYSTGEDHGVHFYAMELVEGPSLDRVIQHVRQIGDAATPQEIGDSEAGAQSESLPDWVDGTIALERPPRDTKPSLQLAASVTASSSLSNGTGYFDAVAEKIAEVADALEHAHNQGIIHRDIKPANLLLAPDGRLSINDFGLARILEQPGVTLTGEFVGTPLYMSPEQITAGRAPLDHRTDIYSLGVTLYELLTLEPPFPGQRRDEVIAKIMHKEAAPPRQKNKRIPRDLETICLKAIEKDPEHRYQSAKHLADDLRRYVNRYAISARRIGPAARAVKYARRHPTMAVSVAFLLLFVCTAGAVLHMLKKGERESARRAAAVKRQNELEAVKEDFRIAILRLDLDDASEKLADAKKLGASEAWTHFASGHISFCNSNFDAAIKDLEFALKFDRESIAIRALLASAELGNQREIAYFDRMKNLQDAKPVDFDDYLYLGAAYMWLDPARALRYLNEAEKSHKNYPYVLIRRCSAIRLCAMDSPICAKTSPAVAGELVQRANSLEQLDPFPWVPVNVVMLHCTAANIYERLAECDPDKSQEYQARANECMTAAKEMKNFLEGFPNDPESHWTLVLLAQWFGDDEEIRRCADRLSETKNLSTFAAQCIGAEFLRMGEFGKAKYWFDLADKGDPAKKKLTQFFQCLADAHSAAERTQLRDVFKAHVNHKIETESDGSYLIFDCSVLMLLGEENFAKEVAAKARELTKDYPNTVGGNFEDVYDYMAEEPTARDPQELLKKCRHSRRALSFAHYCLGIEALSNNDRLNAEKYFNDCLKDGWYPFYVHWLSRALLGQMRRDKDWPNSTMKHDGAPDPPKTE